MSGTQVKRRGDSAAVLAETVIAEREIAIDTTNWTVRVGDGATEGGHLLAKLSDVAAGGLGSLAEVIKTDNYTVATSDAGKMLVANKATAITFALPAVAASASEAYLIRNIGAGLLTVDPNSSEQIEGASTLTLATGRSALIWPNAGKTVWRAAVWLSRAPLAADVAFDNSTADLDGDPATVQAAIEAVAAAGSGGGVPRGHLLGIKLANNSTDATNDIDFGAGECASDENTPILMVHAAGTAQLDVAYGSGNGGRFDSSISDGTWHCFVISNGTTVSRGFSKSLDPTGAANYPSGYTHYRRVASIVRVSSTLVSFKQTGRLFNLLFPPASYNTTPSTSRTSVALRVPTGIEVRALFSASLATASGSSLTAVFPNQGQTDVAPSVTDTPGVDLVAAGITSTVNRAGGDFERVTDTSGQILYRASAASGNLLIVTRGWVDDAAPT